jgi:trk system potassium uptake protein TrkH
MARHLARGIYDATVTPPSAPGPGRLGRRLFRRELAPAQSLAIGFALITLFGAAILATGIAAEGDKPVPFIDALFTASSAITTTGLVTVDTGGAYSTFGEVVVLLMFQVGGLGYMLFIAYFAHLLGTRLSLQTGLQVRETLAGARLGTLREFARSVVIFTAVFEALGAAVYAAVFLARFPLGRAVYLGAFHSVSAFSTAGFGLFADSFMGYRHSVIVHLNTLLITFAGGIGFFVLGDIYGFTMRTVKREGRPRLSVHTKLALAVSVLLIIGGTLVLLAAEPHGTPLGVQILDASFQSISASTTTGFNTVDIGKISQASLLTLIILMFIGTGPGGTGGGIKVTTFGVVVASVLALLRGEQDTVVFRRRMPLDTVYRALSIGMLATVVVVVVMMILSVTERATFLQLLFEVTSALGTVGLSAGITSSLSPVGKIVISLTMLVGRLGPLVVGFALVGRPRRRRLRYVEGEVFVG